MTDSTRTDQWLVVAKPVGANPGLKPDSVSAKARDRRTGDQKKKDKGQDNVGGVVISVRKGNITEEVTRVGFIRETSENPKVDFRSKLDEMIDVAQYTADTLNTLTPDGPLV